jgi:hypothetical protein
LNLAKLVAFVSTVGAMKTFPMLLAVVCVSLTGCAWLRPPTEPSAAARKSLGDSTVRNNPIPGDSNASQGFSNGESAGQQQREADREITKEINRPGR